MGGGSFSSSSSHCSLKEALSVVLERCGGMMGTQVSEPPLGISPWASGTASLASESPSLVTVWLVIFQRAESLQAGS